MKTFNIPTKMNIDFDSVKGVVLDFSGGPDSTLLAYLLAKYKYEVDKDIPLKFVNWQVVNLDEYLTPRVEKIVEWIKSHYDVEIELSILKIYRDNIKRGVDWRTLPVKMVEDFEHHKINSYYQNLLEKGIFSHRATAQNVHMPQELAQELYGEKWRHGWRAERDNNKHIDKPVLTYKTFRPFHNMLKKELFHIADSLSIVDNLMEITNSCNRAVDDTTTNYHCGECYHCIERHWAYGRF